MAAAAAADGASTGAITLTFNADELYATSILPGSDKVGRVGILEMELLKKVFRNSGMDLSYGEPRGGLGDDSGEYRCEIDVLDSDQKVVATLTYRYKVVKTEVEPYDIRSIEDPSCSFTVTDEKYASLDKVIRDYFTKQQEIEQSLADGTERIDSKFQDERLGTFFVSLHEELQQLNGDLEEDEIPVGDKSYAVGNLQRLSLRVRKSDDSYCYMPMLLHVSDGEVSGSPSTATVQQELAAKLKQTLQQLEISDAQLKALDFFFQKGLYQHGTMDLLGFWRDKYSGNFQILKWPVVHYDIEKNAEGEVVITIRQYCKSGAPDDTGSFAYDPYPPALITTKFKLSVGDSPRFELLSQEIITHKDSKDGRFYVFKAFLLNRLKDCRSVTEAKEHTLYKELTEAIRKGKIDNESLVDILEYCHWDKELIKLILNKIGTPRVVFQGGLPWTLIERLYDLANKHQLIKSVFSMPKLWLFKKHIDRDTLAYKKRMAPHRFLSIDFAPLCRDGTVRPSDDDVFQHVWEAVDNAKKNVARVRDAVERSDFKFSLKDEDEFVRGESQVYPLTMWLRQQVDSGKTLTSELFLEGLDKLGVKDEKMRNFLACLILQKVGKGNGIGITSLAGIFNSLSRMPEFKGNPVVTKDTELQDLTYNSQAKEFSIKVRFNLHDVGGDALRIGFGSVLIKVDENYNVTIEHAKVFIKQDTEQAQALETELRETGQTKADYRDYLTTEILSSEEVVSEVGSIPVMGSSAPRETAAEVAQRLRRQGEGYGADELARDRAAATMTGVITQRRAQWQSTIQGVTAALRQGNVKYFSEKDSSQREVIYLGVKTKEEKDSDPDSVPTLHFEGPKTNPVLVAICPLNKKAEARLAEAFATIENCDKFTVKKEEWDGLTQTQQQELVDTLATQGVTVYTLPSVDYAQVIQYGRLDILDGDSAIKAQVKSEVRAVPVESAPTSGPGAGAVGFG